MKNRKQAYNDWKELLEHQELPAIATKNRKEITAMILENQATELKGTGFLTEAEVQGSYVAPGADVAHGIAAGTTDAGVVGVGPSVMGMVRRAIPKLMAFDTVGVQPMNGPTGQVFAMRAIYGSDPRNGKEAFQPGTAPNVSWSGSDNSGATLSTVITNLSAWVTATAYAVGDWLKVPAANLNVGDGTGSIGTPSAIGDYYVVTVVEAYTSGATAQVDYDAGKFVLMGSGLLTSAAELMEGFNGSSGNPFSEMTFRIDKQTVEAKSRQLKAQYSIELAQDLKAVHGLDADSELSGIMSNEILVEIDREFINLINLQAQVGAAGKTGGTTTPGYFDLADVNDVKGARWAGEAYKSLMIQIEKEANEIARQTGRGAGNFIVASRNVVSALAMTDPMITMGSQGLQNGLNTDTNTSVFAGVLGGRFKVYVDQYANEDYFTVGYKGTNEMDAGLFYCPYVPLIPLRGADARNMQPVLAFKTRYGTQVNPFVQLGKSAQVFSGNPYARGLMANQYFRKVRVVGL